MTEMQPEPTKEELEQQAAESLAAQPDIAAELPDPGKPIVLTVKSDIDGHSDVRYLGEPEWAVNTLRAIADSIEAENS